MQVSASLIPFHDSCSWTYTARSTAKAILFTYVEQGLPEGAGAGRPEVTEVTSQALAEILLSAIALATLTDLIEQQA